MNHLQNSNMNTSMQQFNGNEAIAKLIAKDNFPIDVENFLWSLASKVNVFGNLTPQEVWYANAAIDAMELNEFKWMDEEALAEYDENFWLHVRIVTQSIMSISRDGSLLKASMKEDKPDENKPGLGERFGRLGAGGDPNEPSMMEKMGRWKQ